jgi:hypothetical protein
MRSRMNPEKNFRGFRNGLVGILFFLAPLFAISAEILTNDGQVFDGAILEEQADYVLLELKGGVQVRIEKAQIANISKEETPKEEFKTEYPVVGATGGFPGVANLVAGYYLKDVGFKLTGGFLNGGGIQLDLSKKVYENKDWLADISLVGGYSNTSTYGVNWWYDGLGFDVNWRGFTAELNLTNGQPSSSKPTLGVWFQAGYVFRFVD